MPAFTDPTRFTPGIARGGVLSQVISSLDPNANPNPSGFGAPISSIRLSTAQSQNQADGGSSSGGTDPGSAPSGVDGPATSAASAPSTPGFSSAANAGSALGSLASLGLGVPGLSIAGAAIGAAVDANKSSFTNISIPKATVHAVTFGLLGNSVEGQENTAEISEANVDEAVSFGVEPGVTSTVGTPTTSEEGIAAAIDVAEAQAEEEAEANANEAAGGTASSTASADEEATSEPAEADTAGFGSSDGGGDSGSVICTALSTYGLLDASSIFDRPGYALRLYRSDPSLMRGYWRFARPFVRLVHRLPTHGRYIIRPVMRHVVLHLSGKGSPFGRFIVTLFSPLLRHLGRES